MTFMDEANAQKVYEAYNEVYRTGKANPGFHYEIIRKDGTRRHCVVSVALIKRFKSDNLMDLEVFSVMLPNACNSRISYARQPKWKPLGSLPGA